MRWPQRVVAASWLIVLLVVPPLVLVRLVGWPVPGGWPTAEQTRQWLEQPLTESTVTALVSVGAWLMWALLAGTALHRALMRLRAGIRWLRRMPVPTPMQATASGMAGAAVFGFTTSQVATPAISAPLPATADALPPADPNRPAVRDDDARPTGVTLPDDGGWIPQTLAVQVSMLAALLWLHRRRTYQPGQPAAESDLTPLPTTLATVQAAVPSEAALPAAAVSITGRSGSGGALLPDRLPGDGVGLTGAGATDAARGLLITLFLQSGRDGAVRVVTTRALLADLFGPAANLATTIDALHVADTTDDAIAVLETFVADHTEHTPVEGTGATRLVLLTDVLPRPDTATRVAEALRAGHGTATAVVVGTWPHGTTWEVDTTGHTHPAERPQGRLCVLGQVAATDLLTVIAHAQPIRQQPHPHANAADASRTEPPHPPRVPEQRRPVAHTPAPRPASAGPALSLRVLGAPALTHDTTPVTVRRSAALQTLVYLTVHREGADTRHLIEALWPGLPAHTVTGRLYTTISDLRKTLHTATGHPVVDRVGDRYRLHPDHLHVDLWHLHAAARHAETALTGPDRAAGRRTVIDTYTGDLAEGHDWPWLTPHREATRRTVIDAYAALAETAPNPQDAVTLLQDAIRVDPYNEDLHRRAVRALAALRDQAAIDTLLDTYTRRLAAVGLEPHHDLRQPTAHADR